MTDFYAVQARISTLGIHSSKINTPGDTAVALLPVLTSGPNLGVWPDCWVSAEFLRAPIPGKGSGSTTTLRCLILTTISER